MYICISECKRINDFIISSTLQGLNFIFPIGSHVIQMKRFNSSSQKFDW